MYIYYIDTSHIAESFTDIAAAYAAEEKKDKTYGYANEKEFAAYGEIPWSNIIQWDAIKNDKVVKTQTREDFDSTSAGIASGTAVAAAPAVPRANWDEMPLKKPGTPGAKTQATEYLLESLFKSD